MESLGCPTELILAVEKERKKKMDVKMAMVWAGVIAGLFFFWRGVITLLV